MVLLMRTTQNGTNLLHTAHCLYLHYHELTFFISLLLQEILAQEDDIADNFTVHFRQQKTYQPFHTKPSMTVYTLRISE